MSYATRKDVRTDEQFASDIALDTAKQREWAKIFQTHVQHKTGKLCEKVEYGVDNDGNVVRGNLMNDNVDNIFVFGNNNFKIEFKTIPEWCNNFMTFKASSLKSCVQQEARIIVPKRFVFYSYSVSTCKHLHDKHPHRIYWNFKTNKGFSPNDLAVRVYKKEIEDFVSKRSVLVYRWPDVCRTLIEDNWKFLSKEKVR